MLVFVERVLYIPGSVLGQENAAINRAHVVLVLGRDDQMEMLEHTGPAFTIIWAFVLVTGYLSLEEEMDEVGVPGFWRLQGTPLFENVPFIKPVSRRPVGSIPLDQGTHIFFASWCPLSPLKCLYKLSL